MVVSFSDASFFEAAKNKMLPYYAKNSKASNEEDSNRRNAEDSTTSVVRQFSDDGWTKKSEIVVHSRSEKRGSKLKEREINFFKQTIQGKLAKEYGHLIKEFSAELVYVFGVRHELTTPQELLNLKYLEGGEFRYHLDDKAHEAAPSRERKYLEDLTNLVNQKMRDNADASKMFLVATLEDKTHLLSFRIFSYSGP